MGGESVLDRAEPRAAMGRDNDHEVRKQELLYRRRVRLDGLKCTGPAFARMTTTCVSPHNLGVGSPLRNAFAMRSRLTNRTWEWQYKPALCREGSGGSCEACRADRRIEEQTLGALLFC